MWIWMDRVLTECQPRCQWSVDGVSNEWWIRVYRWSINGIDLGYAWTDYRKDLQHYLSHGSLNIVINLSYYQIQLLPGMFRNWHFSRYYRQSLSISGRSQRNAKLRQWLMPCNSRGSETDRTSSGMPHQNYPSYSSCKFKQPTSSM